MGLRKPPFSWMMVGIRIRPVSSGSERVCFFFNDTPTPEIYPLSLHDALPISDCPRVGQDPLDPHLRRAALGHLRRPPADRKSTRLNSSHRCISNAVFCLK